MPFRVLTVCVGNVCRSPLAERLLGARLGASVEVVSAGTHGMAGAPMGLLAAAQLERLGGSVTGFRARRLEESHLMDADLVLAATRGVRRDALGVAPSAMRRTFTFGELAAICAAAGDELPVEAHEVVAYAATHRHLAATAGQDLLDPIGRDPAVHRGVADEIARLVTVIANALDRSR